MSESAEWYLVEGGKSVGPIPMRELLGRLPGAGGPGAMVFGPGLAAWTAAGQVPAIAAAGAMGYASPPPVPTGGSYGPADEISYQVRGSELQYVEVALSPGQMVIGEPGFMMYMTGGVQMNTVFGDPSAQGSSGFFDKVMAAGKRALAGESMFISTFTAASGRAETVVFAAPHPGKVVPFDLRQHNGEILVQKECFLCAARGVRLNIAFQKKISVGLFGGEGFIMQRLNGAGVALIGAGGGVVERELGPGESLRMETGNLVALESNVSFDVQWVGGIKNALFGAEGLFFATVTGPGKVWIQTMPFSRLAARVLSHFHAPAGGGESGGGAVGANALLGMGLGALLGNRDQR